MIAALLLAIALQGGAGATADVPAPVPEPTVMVVEFFRAVRFIGFPKRCPGATDDESDDGICDAELYEGRASVIRHLSGPDIREGERIRLTSHGIRWPAGTRLLVATLPFEDQAVRGSFAFWWKLPMEGDDFCVTTAELARWDDSALKRAFLRAHVWRFRPFGYDRRENFRCILGEA